MLHTATGNELPDVRTHIERVQAATGAELVDLRAPTLAQLIAEQGCLPNWRMRWCTRMIKIEPVAKWLRQCLGTRLAVGLRADEPGRVGGTYDAADVSYPLREWGWNEGDVRACCLHHGLTPPPRTDCAVCFFQTLGEWRELWQNHPDLYAEGEAWEAQVGHTFRSPQRDTWPAGLRELRAEFEAGRTPRARTRKVMCRVCSM
jgi:3'-phosphoadenosine 5'-phosphosulfate sulfotransferase (PAPS reductase)/FAD synthetase